jgi:hypothetical protein
VNRPTFASQITSSVALAEARSSSTFKDTKHSISVNLRRYRGLKTSGYGVTNKSVIYEAFKLSLTFREAPPEESFNQEIFPRNSLPTVNSSMLLVISATHLKSVYKSKTMSLFLYTKRFPYIYLLIFLSKQATKFSRFNVTTRNSPRVIPQLVFLVMWMELLAFWVSCPKISWAKK